VRNSLNPVFERDLDALMTRTAVVVRFHSEILRRSAHSRSGSAPSTGFLAFFFNWLAALLSLATILFYGLFYTLLLKPNTAQNIVIAGGRRDGSGGRLGAATGSTGWIPWIMFAIIFLWTPPHFWALAIAYKDDYRVTGLPMMPLVQGDRSTLLQMAVYSFALVAVTLSLGIFGAGWIYMVAASILGWAMIQRSLAAYRTGEMDKSRTVSVLYLLPVRPVFGHHGGCFSIRTLLARPTGTQVRTAGFDERKRLTSKVDPSFFGGEVSE